MSAYKLPGANFQYHELPTEGFDILYAEAGRGDVLVSLPGSAGIEMSLGKDWLAERFRVIEINPPGWGPKDDLSGRLDQRELAHLLAKVIQNIGVESYHLLGTSMGGVNALWIALEYPQRVQSLILDASMTFMAEGHSRNPDGDRFIEALRAGHLPPEAAAQALANLPPAPVYPAKPWMDQAYFHTLMSNRMRMFPHVPHAHEAEMNARAAEVACPVLALVGNEDEILKVDIEEAYRKYMPQARFTRVPGGTHDLQGSHPEEFARLIGEFLAAARPAKPS
jgi:pimeloyl-ACP methyl ester carboxylesterase